MKNMRLVIMGIIVTVYILILGILLRYSFKPVMHISDIDHVSVSLDGEDIGVANDINYLKHLDRVLRKGQELELSFTLPNIDNTILPAIEFMTDGCGYEIYIDDQLLDTKNMDRVERGRFVGNDYKIVSLPKDSSGKQLTFKLKTSLRKVRNPISDIAVGNRLDMFNRFVYHNAMPLLMGIFLMLYGATFLFISLILNGWVDGLKSNVIASVICIALGIFLHSYYKCCYIYADTTYMKAFMYTSLSVLPSCMLRFAFTVSRGIWYTKRRYIYIGFDVACVLVNVMHYIGALCFDVTKYVLYLMMAIFAAIILVKYILDRRKNNLDEGAAIQMPGLLILCILMYGSAFSDMLQRMLAGHSDSMIMFIAGNCYCVGSLLFAYFQLVNFYINITGAHARTVEFESLAYLAYADGLTGLYNRSKLNQQLEEWEKDGDNYCIISLDLNGLKTVNDNYGHNAGDELLKVFGKALSDVFSESGMVGRIGGDEFMVIMRKVGTEEVEAILRMLDAKLEVINTVKTEPWDYSTAYGYGFRVECGKDCDDYIHQTYLLADQRMYEAKKQHHKKHRIAPR